MFENCRDSNHHPASSHFNAQTSEPVFWHYASYTFLPFPLVEFHVLPPSIVAGDHKPPTVATADQPRGSQTTSSNAHTRSPTIHYRLHWLARTSFQSLIDSPVSPTPRPRRRTTMASFQCDARWWLKWNLWWRHSPEREPVSRDHTGANPSWPTGSTRSNHQSGLLNCNFTIAQLRSDSHLATTALRMLSLNSSAIYYH